MSCYVKCLPLFESSGKEKVDSLKNAAADFEGTEVYYELLLNVLAKTCLR